MEFYPCGHKDCKAYRLWMIKEYDDGHEIRVGDVFLTSDETVAIISRCLMCCNFQGQNLFKPKDDKSTTPP